MDSNAYKKIDGFFQNFRNLHIILRDVVGSHWFLFQIDFTKKATFLYFYAYWQLDTSWFHGIFKKSSVLKILGISSPEHTGLFRAECNFWFWNYGHLSNYFIGFLGFRLGSDNGHLIYLYQFVTAIFYSSVIVIQVMRYAKKIVVQAHKASKIAR